MHSLNGEHASKSQAGGLEMVKHANRLIWQRLLTIGKISGDRSTFHLLHVWGLSGRKTLNMQRCQISGPGTGSKKVLSLPVLEIFLGMTKVSIEPVDGSWARCVTRKGEPATAGDLWQVAEEVHPHCFAGEANLAVDAAA
jgi:hypothetical protein